MKIKTSFIYICLLAFNLSCGSSEETKKEDCPKENPQCNTKDDPNHDPRIKEPGQGVKPGYGGDGFFSSTKVGSIQFKNGFSNKIKFDVKAGTDSFSLLLEGQKSYFYIPNTLKSPSAKDWVIGSFHPQFCFSCENRVAATESVSSSLYPNTPRLAMETGIFEVAYRGYTFNQNKTALINYNGQGNLFLLKKNKKVSGQGKIDLNLWFTGGTLNSNTAKTNTNFQNAINQLKNIYGVLGIKFEKIRYYDCPNGTPNSIFSILGSNSDLSAVLSSGGAKEPGLNLFFVKTIQDKSAGGVGIILGVAGGIPGPPLQMGTIKSGVAVSTLLTLSNTKLLALTIAHEMGHFLGLFHSTENPNIGVGRVYDNIDDSPKDSSNNLMYFNASNAGTAISNGQKEVIYRSLWVY